MTITEFSNEFDVLLNSHSQQLNFGESNPLSNLTLNEYEKSLFLTSAQEQIVKGLYDGSLFIKSFEETEELRRYLDSLVKTARLTTEDTYGSGITLSNNSYIYILPEDLLFITYEQAIVGYHTEQRTVEVIPEKQDEWHRIRKNPFRCPNNRKVIRLDYGNNMVELIAAEGEITEYKLRYICKPTPIILTTLPDGLSINGEHTITECKLNTALHRIILERAVQLAYSRFPQERK